MRIANFNVNGVNGRLLRWLEAFKPDIACLQELKTSDEKFPVEAIEQAGYGAIWHGQKSYNGIAILVRDIVPVERRRGLPGDADDTHSRYLEAQVDDLIVGCLYLPNGNPAPGPKFDYKLRWLDRLQRYSDELVDGPAAVLCGDFNVVPTDIDAVVPKRWLFDAVYFPESRAAFNSLLDEGWTDALRKLHPEKGIYTYWNFGFRGGYDKSSGLRMDHFLLNESGASRLKSGGVDIATRSWDKPSDHAPAWIELSKSAINGS
jgi:exodeoxyribonuclease-3